MQLFSTRYYKALNKILSRIQYVSNLRLSHPKYFKKYSERKRFFKGEHSDSVYVINPDIASSISSCIAKEWHGGYLFEANAGPGILSSYLLQNGITHLRVFEKKNEFLSALEVLAGDYPNLEIVQQDLMVLPSLEFRKRVESSNESNSVNEFFESAFKDIPKYPWENGISFQVFSVIADKKSNKFLRYLLAALPNKSTLFSYGRCEFFLLITETEFMCMKALPKENFSMYRWSTVLYNLFFEIKCLQKFSPDPKNFLFNRLPYKKNACENYNLIKLTPKPDLYSHQMTQEKLLDFSYFVRFHLAKRSNLVIKSIEQWIPFSGPRLIKEGMNVFLRFGDLSPGEILWLFNTVYSWPEYTNCNLRAFSRKFDKKKINEDENFTE